MDNLGKSGYDAVLESCTQTVEKIRKLGAKLDNKHRQLCKLQGKLLLEKVKESVPTHPLLSSIQTIEFSYLYERVLESGTDDLELVIHLENDITLERNYSSSWGRCFESVDLNEFLLQIQEKSSEFDHEVFEKALGLEEGIAIKELKTLFSIFFKCFDQMDWMHLPAYVYDLDFWLLKL